MASLTDIEFNTGPAKHKITAGYYGTQEKYFGTTYRPNTTYRRPVLDRWWADLCAGIQLPTRYDGWSVLCVALA